MKIGNAQLYLDISQDYFKGGKTVNIVDNSGNPITKFLKLKTDGSGDYETITSGLDASGAFVKVSLTADGAETTSGGSSFKYVIPRKLVGTNYADDIWSENKLINVDDNFTVEALSGDDQIDNVGASNVYIDGGFGADVIRLLANDTVYGENVTVNGWIGNDSIYAEYETVASNSADTAYATQINIEGVDYYAKADKKAKFGHTYEVGWNTGTDSIYFFGDRDVIKITEGSSYVGCSVESGTNDLVIGIGSGLSATRASAWVVLKDFRKEKIEDVDRFSVPLNILQWDENANGYATIDAGKISIDAVTDNFYNNIIFSSTTWDDTITNSGNNVLIEALQGNDEILNIGENVTINAGYGNDSIFITGDNNSIAADYGNDAIFLNDAVENTIVAGVGTDTIFAYRSGGNVYQFDTYQGVNYIYGFQDGDTVSFAAFSDTAIYREITSEGVVLSLKNSSGYATTSVNIKGTLTATSALTDLQNTFSSKKSSFEIAKQNFLTNPGETERLAYENARAEFISATQNLNAYISDSTLYPKLAPNTKIAIQSADGVSIYNVPKILAGTNYSDYSEGGVPVDNGGVGDLVVSGADMDNYTVDAKAGNDFIFSNSSNVSISGGIGNDTISLGSSAFHNTVYGGVGNDSINNTCSGTTYIYSGNTSEGNDTITGFKQGTDLIYVSSASATISFALNVSNNLVATINYNGTTYSTILLDGVSSGSVRYKIADGEIQTYTIS